MGGGVGLGEQLAQLLEEGADGFEQGSGAGRRVLQEGRDGRVKGLAEPPPLHLPFGQFALRPLRRRSR